MNLQSFARLAGDSICTLTTVALLGNSQSSAYPRSVWENGTSITGNSSTLYRTYHSCRHSLQTSKEQSDIQARAAKGGTHCAM